uniref:Uncharacterized protein n=1 Tax=Meloidogyne enterolobii TaxID=390850 RepID=A0A6V7XZ29_MELEN|nr:unnamed protein product [Meloidogyne enterolobii]
MCIQTTKGRQPEKVLEIQTMIQNKRRELASKGKYIQGKSNNCAVEGLNFDDLGSQFTWIGISLYYIFRFSIARLSTIEKFFKRPFHCI